MGNAFKRKAQCQWENKFESLFNLPILQGKKFVYMQSEMPPSGHKGKKILNLRTQKQKQNMAVSASCISLKLLEKAIAQTVCSPIKLAQKGGWSLEGVSILERNYKKFLPSI